VNEVSFFYYPVRGSVLAGTAYIYPTDLAVRLAVIGVLVGGSSIDDLWQ